MLQGKFSKLKNLMQFHSFSMYYIFINKETMKNKKDVMLTLRIDSGQYLKLLETLVKERKSKSTFIRESIQKSIENGYPKNCRKNDIVEWINSL